MLNRRRLVAPVLVALGATVGCSTPPTTSSSSNASAPATTASPSLAPLTRSLHPLARKELSVGHRDPSIVTAGSLYFKLSAAQRADRDALVEAVQTPSSPSYHKWLSAEDYAARFGARPADIARVRGWLEGQGLTIDRVSRTGSRIQFRGTGGQVEAAFHTEIDNYAMAGQHHYAMATAPMIPSELAPVVLGLKGFHDFHKHHPALRHVSGPATTDPIYGETALGPADFAVLYDTGPLTTAGTTGTGVNLVIIGETYFNTADIASFRSHFDITGVNEVDVLVPNTGTQAVNNAGDEGETELDLEWSSAVAPGANIVFVYTGNDKNFSVDDSVAYAVEEGAHLVPGTGNGAAQIISESYGGCDVDYEGSDADIDGEIAAAANLEGITYLAASGDSAAAGCLDEGVGGLFTGPPADMPGVTGVGGTEFCGGQFGGSPAGCFYASSPAVNVQTTPWFVDQNAVEYPVTPGGLSLEGAWNDSDIAYGPGGGGGAPSIIFSKPAYQQGVAGMPNDGARDVPDVALTASANNLGYLVWEETTLADGGSGDTLGPIGGTSASTPSFAGILARVNQAVAAHGAPLGLGNVNPQLYAMFANNGQLGAFHDIVLGDNIVPCDPTDPGDYPSCPALADGGTNSSYGGFSAHPGYDLTSGLGSVDATKLVAAWVALTPTTTALDAPTNASAGTPITLTATITSASNASTNLVGGTVTFAFLTLSGDAGAPYSFDAGGGPDESWVLGTVNVTAVAGAPEKGRASLSTAVPAGLYGQTYLVAEYSGDTNYLASNSPMAAPVKVSASSLEITPGTYTLAPTAQTTFAVTGGAPPVTWGIEGTDTTCARVKHLGEVCSQIESLTPTTGAFAAGPVDGTVTIVAVDTLGNEALAQITVSGVSIDAGFNLPTVDDAGPAGGPTVGPIPAWDGGEPTTDAGTWGGFDAASPPTSEDAGEDAGEDGGPGVTTEDSGPIVANPDSGPVGTTPDSGPVVVASDDAGEDGGTPAPSGNNGGCSCVVAGAEHGGSAPHGAAFGGLLLGFAAIGRRRARKNARKS